MEGDESLSIPMSERADMELVNEIRVWSKKYIDMSTIGGLNMGWLSY